ncbi:hypothetical protein M3Y98_00770100 [Aphelenchoides besseyi]|nr:hypothetical protein M3Y98_00770100 [Aphelenchoides besseyi]
MIGLDVCRWNHTNEHFCALYSTELCLAIFAFLINFLIFVYSLSGDRFNPHTAMVRLLLFVDVVSSCGHVFESLDALLERNPDFTDIATPPEVQFIPVSSCIIYRPYLFLFLMARQFGACIVFVIGLERFLFIRYPLWFKVVRVRRLPIVIFTSFFIFLSSSIAYTNSLVVIPNEGIHFTCESTFAFGDNYGWCQSALIISSLVAAWMLNYYAHTVARQEKALAHFGNNRSRMASERRKIKKAIFILTIMLIFGALPQIAIVVLRLISRWRLQQWKLIVQQTFLLKVFANMFMVRKLARGSSIWRVLPRVFCCCIRPKKPSRNVVADNVESVASISKYVH